MDTSTQELLQRLLQGSLALDQQRKQNQDETESFVRRILVLVADQDQKPFVDVYSDGLIRWQLKRKRWGYDARCVVSFELYQPGIAYTTDPTWTRVGTSFFQGKYAFLGADSIEYARRSLQSFVEGMLDLFPVLACRLGPMLQAAKK